MKKLIGFDVGSYTFDASAKTITIDNISSLSLEQILVITNVTDNIIIYNFADTTKGGSLTGFVLTLDYDTTSMSDTDELQIWVWEEEHYTTKENRNLLSVPTRASLPTGHILTDVEISGDVSSLDYYYYVIPNGVTINLLSFMSMSEISKKDGNASAVYYDELGDFSAPVRITKMITNGNTDREYFNPDEYEYTGDGTKRLVITREPLGSGTVYIESILKIYKDN